MIVLRILDPAEVAFDFSRWPCSDVETGRSSTSTPTPHAPATSRFAAHAAEIRRLHRLGINPVDHHRLPAGGMPSTS
ncbi:MAG: hypothetical protein WKF75_04055 [Singulisphaera sp.]